MSTIMLSGCLIAVGLISVVFAQLPDYCDTPRGATGECIALNKCPPLYAILQHRPIKAADADYLRNSQCGFEGKLPKVCCPTGDNEQTTEPPRQPNRPVNNDLLPSTEVCGIDTQDRIYGGEKAALSEFPWMTLIEYERDNGRRGFYCGGVLISKRYILTAAHCIKGKDLPRSWKIVSVRLGEYNTETDEDCENNGFSTVCAPPPLNVPVEEKVAHNQYDPYDINQYHDIALLRLAREVTFSGYVKPICLPKTAEDQSREYTGKKLTVAGWGKTENRSESNVKLKLDVPVRGNNECTRTYRAANVNLSASQLCAGGEKGKDSCRGDSGGPLMSFVPDQNGEINWYSVGVVSFGPSPCGMENWPGVYTKVANYIPWILSVMRP